jgi:hypothetical protein
VTAHSPWCKLLPLTSHAGAISAKGNRKQFKEIAALAAEQAVLRF